jgi:hypothetical protein
MSTRDEVFELLQKRYAKRNSISIEEIDEKTLEILSRRATRICRGVKDEKRETEAPVRVPDSLF